MNSEEFNAKWKHHIEEGFEDQGMMINNPLVIDYVDVVFSCWEGVGVPFTFSQIKSKFGMIRAYVTLNGKDHNELEDVLNSYVKNNNIKI